MDFRRGRRGATLAAAFVYLLIHPARLLSLIAAAATALGSVAAFAAGGAVPLPIFDAHLPLR